MLRVFLEQSIPDPYQFVLTVRDVEPRFNSENLTLTIYTASGIQHPWGTTSVTSTLILHDPKLVAIHIRFCHRHGSGQYWRYYRLDSQNWNQVPWNALLTPDRLKVLEAYKEQAAAFAALPGGLLGKPSDLPLKVGSTYLLVHVEGGKYSALGNPSFEYCLGTSYPRDQTHSASMVSYPYHDTLLIKWHTGTLPDANRQERPTTIALLECSVSGTIEMSEGRVSVLRFALIVS